MHSRPNTKSMVEGALLAALTVLLSLLGVYLPLIGAFISFLWPVPIVILGLRHGLKWSIMATIVSGLLLSLLATPLQALSSVLAFGLLGIVLGEAIRRELSVGMIIWLGAIASLASKLLLFAVAFLLLGINSFDQSLVMLQQSTNQVLSFYSKTGMDQNQLAMLKKSFTDVINLMKIIFPALLVLVAITDTFLNYLVSQLILKRLGYPAKKIPPFSQWKLPRWVMWGFVLGIIFLLAGQHYKMEALTNIGLNLEYFYSMLFIAQGLAVTSFYLEKLKTQGLVKLLILFILFITPLFVGLLVWVGLLDTYFDYRRIVKSNKP